MSANIMDIVAPAVWIIPPEMLSKNGVVVTASIIMGTAKYTNLTRNIFTPFISISFRLLNSGTLSVPLIIPCVEISSILYSYPKNKNIGILITDHNVQETLAITDKTYLMFEGGILKAGVPEELVVDEMVRRVYLGQNFELRKKKLEF